MLENSKHSLSRVNVAAWVSVFELMLRAFLNPSTDHNLEENENLEIIHSCILIERSRERPLIDPGPFTFIEGKVKAGDFSGVTFLKAE